jgi:uncharacterized protein (TIGR00290 family)
MTQTEKVLLTWSGGKDSAMALYKTQMMYGYDISALLTTVTEGYERISMHGVQSFLLEAQAESLGLPVEKIYITSGASNQEYEDKMRDKLLNYRSQGVFSVVFGDIFLEELRKYREGNLSKLGMRAIFPLWNWNTVELAHTFIDLGFKSIITCVDSNALDNKFVGRGFDKQFLQELPPDVDPCGENGEFHSFVYDGPIFRKKIAHRKGEVVLRDKRFYFCDVIPT